MANIIDIIVGKQAQSEVDKLIASLKETHEEIIKINQTGLKLNSSGSPKNPQQMNVAVKEAVAINERLEQTQKKLVVSAKELERQSIKESSARNALNKQREQSLKALEKEQRLLETAQNLYNKTQTQLNNVTKAYNDLATRKARYNNLTENEEKRLNTLSNVIGKYNTALKSVDTTIGKHQRNVGNYAMQNTALSGSINQLTREMPAFANSAQTGFMAISNNLPIFFDAISNTRKEIKALQADGKQVPSLFSQLTSSLFSWGTALSVGVTLLTVYGKEIGEFIKKTIEGSKAFNVFAESQKQINEASILGTKNAQEEIVKMRSLLEVAKDTSLSYKERMIAVNELQNTYPAYFGNLNKEKILAGETAEAERNLTSAILSRAKANAAVEKITENQSKIIDLEVKELELRKKLTEARNAEARAIAMANSQSQYTRGEGAAYGAVSAISDRSVLEKNLINLLKEKKNIEDLNNKLTAYAVENDKKSILLKAKNTEETKKNTTAKKENITKQKEEQTFLVGTIGWFEKQIDLKQKELELIKQNSRVVLSENEDYKQQTIVIDELQKGLNYLLGIKEKLAEEPMQGISIPELDVDIFDQIVKDKEELDKWLKQYKEGFVSSFFDQAGFSKLFFLIENFDKLKESGTGTALAISEAFQEAFNTISNASQANYQYELERLANQKEIAIRFAGESTTARAEIERQYEERRRQIERQRAEQQKRLAIFNIATNTAQAIMAVFAKTPPPAGIPLALLVGAIGAAQLAMTASQPIPAFADGGTHKGGLMLVNDAKGSNYQETIVTPDGKVHKPKGRNVLMNAPKGTEIYTPEQWNAKLNSMLVGSGIEPMKGGYSSGMSKSDFEEIFSKFANKDSYHFSIDEKGIQKTITRNGQKVNIANSRFRAKKYDV